MHTYAHAHSELIEHTLRLQHCAKHRAEAYHGVYLLEREETARNANIHEETAADAETEC